MLGPTAAEPTAPLDTPTSGAAGVPRSRRKSRFSLLSLPDRIVLALMVGIPTVLFVSLIWLPTIASIVLSFTDWRGIGAVLVAASWRHVGYVMVLYLAGLKSVDPTLREAAAIDGANARQTFFRVIFPVMRPINIVIIVITVIESLRAFDIVYILNRGK